MPRLRGVGYHESRKTAALLNVSIPPHPEVSVIVPARNEEACLADCLRSLAGQDGPSYEVIVVDDQSTDATHSIAESFPVRVISADPLPPGWSGKCNAVWSGAKAARGKWLLFTDADTKHSPHSISAGLSEAAGFDAALLSYSPKQEVHSFAERALMPVIFAELAATYRPKDVCDPNSPVAAANGQYLLDPPRCLRRGRRPCRCRHCDPRRCCAGKARQTGRRPSALSCLGCCEHPHVSQLFPDVGGLDQEPRPALSAPSTAWPSNGWRSFYSSSAASFWRLCSSWMARKSPARIRGNRSNCPGRLSVASNSPCAF